MQQTLVDEASTVEQFRAAPPTVLLVGKSPSSSLSRRASSVGLDARREALDEARGGAGCLQLRCVADAAHDDELGARQGDDQVLGDAAVDHTVLLAVDHEGTAADVA